MLNEPIHRWCLKGGCFCLSQCDGTDLTPKIQELKFQCIVFLNIPRWENTNQKTRQNFRWSIGAKHVVTCCLQVLCWHHALGKHGRSPRFWAAAPRWRLHRGHRLHHGLAGEKNRQMNLREAWRWTLVTLTLVHQAALQVGGHGERLHQCREVVLTTFKTIPVQVRTGAQLEYELGCFQQKIALATDKS